VSIQLPAGKETALVTGLERSHRVEELRRLGVKFSKSEVPSSPCSIVELPTPGKPAQYVAGFGNFAAITAYNRSTFYASAVLDLAKAIRSARDQQLLVDEHNPTKASERRSRAQGAESKTDGGRQAG
jgi:membrane-bound lytic murein transglycosylase B